MAKIKYILIHLLGLFALSLAPVLSAQQGGFASREMSHVERRILYYQDVINSDISPGQRRRANDVYDAYLAAESSGRASDREYADKLHDRYIKEFGFVPEFDPFYVKVGG